MDSKGLERLVEHLIKGGVYGIFILGTTGEAPNLPYDVRSALIQQTCEHAGSRVPVIVGITDTSYQDALRMAAKAMNMVRWRSSLRRLTTTRLGKRRRCNTSSGWQRIRLFPCFSTMPH